MKVAIMGAGMAGLACAKHLEDNGISPDIFERRHRVGERFPNMEIISQMMNRPIKDPLTFLSKKYGIDLLPAGIIHTMEIHSPNHTATLTGGSIGYTSIRGNDERSLERQLAKQVKSKINFNSKATWQELEKDYDWVVIATGDPTISRELGVWKTDTEAFLMGCLVKGKFSLGLCKIWLDQEMSKQCMTYFIPCDTDEACYSIAAIPSSNEELEKLWERVVEKLNINPIRNSIYKFEEYKLGRTSTKQVGKVLLTGAAGGFVEPFMGFGQISAILSGVYAAIAITTGQDYNKLTKWYSKRYMSCLKIRKYVNQLDNDGFDKLVSVVDNPAVSSIIADSEVQVLGIASMLAQIGGLAKKAPSKAGRS